MRTKILAAALAAATALSACSSVDSVTTSSVSAPMDSVVKIVTNDGMGHGSGVHIGNGYIVTAAHVVSGGLDYVRFDGGEKEDAQVLWSNSDYDVALIRFDGEAPSANMDCRTPRLGENIRAFGSPGREDFVVLFGHAASKSREHPRWKDVVVTDIAASGGMSGGPVLADDGRVVGIVVGVMLTAVARASEPKGMEDYDFSQVGISYVVPASTVCALMGEVTR